MSCSGPSRSGARSTGPVSSRIRAARAAIPRPQAHFLKLARAMKDASFVLYLDKSEEKLPVLLEAVMPFATAKVSLQKASAPR